MYATVSKFMELKFNPYITDAFVEIIKDHKSVRKQVESLTNEFGEEKAHEIVKNITIAALTLYRVNVNDLIDHLREKHS